MKAIVRALAPIILLFGLALPLATQARQSESSDSKTAFETNYLLSLTLARPDKPPTKISDVFAAPELTFSVQSLMTFDGTITTQGRALLLKYDMRIQRKVRHHKHEYMMEQQTLRASVRLIAGQPLIVFKDPNETITLKISKLNQGGS